MPEQDKIRDDHEKQTEKDYESYRMLLDLWKGENPIKTTKLQVLLAVNALLVSSIGVSGGFKADKWFIYVAGAVFSFIWTFSIGRTSLFQDVWQAKMGEIQRRNPTDPRFAILDTESQRQQARCMMRIFGGIPSRWYLLYSPFTFAIAWLVVLVVAK